MLTVKLIKLLLIHYLKDITNFCSLLLLLFSSFRSDILFAALKSLQTLQFFSLFCCFGPLTANALIYQYLFSVLNGNSEPQQQSSGPGAAALNTAFGRSSIPPKSRSSIPPKSRSSIPPKSQRHRHRVLPLVHLLLSCRQLAQRLHRGQLRLSSHHQRPQIDQSYGQSQGGLG